MSKRDDLIAKYAADMKDKLGVAADMDLLTKVVIGCGGCQFLHMSHLVDVKWNVG